MLTTGCKLIDFTEFGDERGKLVVIEGGIDIPFQIRRTFYIYGSDMNAVRGKHANRKSEFVLINIGGTSKVRVDNGKQSEIIELNRPHSGIYIPKMIWKDMYDFSEDSILLVLSSEHYDESEYIRDYDEYVREVNEYNE